MFYERIITFFIMAVMCFAMAACGHQESSDTNNDSDKIYIRSNGQMSWYIGAVGGSGTYTVEGDKLRAELTDSMEQKELPMDFMIMGKGEIKMTYDDMEIIWTYRDKEDTLSYDE